MTEPARDPAKDQEIERRAYALWESEGRPEGRDKHHWSQAERDFAESRDSGSSGAPEFDSTLVPAHAVEGEGVPETESQPIAATPDTADAERSAGRFERSRRGSRTGP